MSKAANEFFLVAKIPYLSIFFFIIYCSYDTIKPRIMLAAQTQTLHERVH